MLTDTQTHRHTNSNFISIDVYMLLLSIKHLTLSLRASYYWWNCLYWVVFWKLFQSPSTNLPPAPPITNWGSNCKHSNIHNVDCSITWEWEHAAKLMKFRCRSLRIVIMLLFFFFVSQFSSRDWKCFVLFPAFVVVINWW